MLIRDYNKIEENMKQIRNPILVLKDNAYGFGIERIVEIAIRNNIHMFAVNTVEEANRILKMDDTAYIILISPVRDVNRRLIYTVADMDDYMFCVKNKLSFHYELNMGMNRFGFNDINNSVISNQLCEGIFYHSNGIDILEDYKRFNLLLKKINRYDLIIHIGGSKCSSFKHGYHNRIGEILYRNSYRIEGKIIKIRKVSKGENIGYGDIYIAKRDLIIGIIDVGYKEGLLEKYNYKVYINNKTYKTIGLLCMDYSFVIIEEDVNLNDMVIFDLTDDRSIHEQLLSLK